MHTSRPISRWRAAGIHVGITVVVAILVGTLLFGIWYPPPYFGAGGADHLMLVLVLVDLTIGPLLTLIVFKSGKWGMKFDLCVIALLQLAALGYGLHVIAESRPIFLVGNLDRFVLVPSNAIADTDLAKGRSDAFRTRSMTGARLVGASIPDEAARQKLISAALAGLDIENFPEYYVPYDSVSKEMLQHAKPLDTLLAKPGAAPIVEDWLARNHRDRASVEWVPVVSRAYDLSMLIDATTGEPLRAFPIDPW
jgi:hypothetical protein